MPGEEFDYQGINQEQPYGDFPLRLLGTDAPYRGDRSDIPQQDVSRVAHGFDEVPSNLQTINQQGWKALQQTGNVLSDGIKQAQAADDTITKSTEAAYNLTIPGALARARINTYVGNQTPQYLENIGHQISSYLQRQDNENKLTEEKREKLAKDLGEQVVAQQKKDADNSYTNATWKMANLRLTDPDKIRDDPSGYQNQIAQIVSDPNLTGEQKRELIDKGYLPLSEVARQNSQRKQQALDESQRAQKDVAQEEFLLPLHGKFAALKAGSLDLNSFFAGQATTATRDDILAGEGSGYEQAVNPKDPNVQSFEEYVNEFKNSHPQFSSLDVASLIVPALREVNSDASISADQRTKINQTLSNYQRFTNELAPIEADYRNGNITAQAYKANEAALAYKYNLNGALSAPFEDPDAAQKHFIETQELNNKTDRLAQDQIITKVQSQEVNDELVGKTIYQLEHHPGLAQQILADPVLKNSPLWQRAIAAQKDLHSDQNRQRQLLNENDVLQKQKLALASGSVYDQAKLIGGNNQTFSNYGPNLPTDPTQARAQGTITQDQFNELQSAAKKGTLTPEQLTQLNQIRDRVSETLDAHIQRNISEITQIRGRYSPYHWEDGETSFVKYLNTHIAKMDAIEKAYNIQQQGNPQGTAFQPNAQNPNFNGAMIPSNISYTSATLGGRKVSLPFAANSGFQGVSDGYGTPGNGVNQHHVHFHAGIDLAAKEGTPVLAQGYGKVIHSYSPDQVSGYGNMIDVMYQDGKVVRYGHLQNRNVREGDDIYPGEAIGRVGHTGDATGPHLHYEVRTDSNWGAKGTIDPIGYLQGLAASNNVVQARSDNRQSVDKYNPYSGGNPETAPSRLLPPGAMPIPGGYLLNNKVFPYKEQDYTPTVDRSEYNTAKPLRNSAMPTRTVDYHGSNDLYANYGYGYLARNPQVANKLASVSTRLGIPAIWLADIINRECSWNPQDSNREGYGGLIGFGNDDARQWGLPNAQALWKLPASQQLDYVYRYLEPYKGRLNSVQAVSAAVFGGGGGLKRYERDPQEALSNLGDGHVRLSEYLRGLGRDVGRQYAF